MFSRKKKVVQYDQHFVRLFAEAGVYVARWHGCNANFVRWDASPYMGWVLLSGADFKALLEDTGIHDDVPYVYLRALEGAASRAYLEEPVKMEDTPELLKMPLLEGWQSQLSPQGPAKEFRWDGKKFYLRDNRPKWAKGEKEEPPMMPLGHCQVEVR